MTTKNGFGVRFKTKNINHLLYSLILVGSLVGCFTMQDRLVTLSPTIAVGSLTRTELSEAIDTVQHVAIANHLSLEMDKAATNLLALYVRRSNGVYRDPIIYMAVWLEPTNGNLVVATSDIPSNEHAATASRIHKEIYKGLTERFGKSRVKKKTKIMSNPAWFL
ncbi:MAG: hypothetical protein HY298_03710 [Verrucomicrobia bacterium]|nr:hypothetical protein [Verrucomicrobiota bacterium]